MFNDSVVSQRKLRVLVAGSDHGARRLLSQLVGAVSEMTMIGFVRERDQVATRAALSTPDLLLLHLDFADTLASPSTLRSQPGLDVIVWAEASLMHARRRMRGLAEVLVVPDGSGGRHEEEAQRSSASDRLKSACGPLPRLEPAAREPAPKPAAPTARGRTSRVFRPQALVIGSSTGGPVALTTLVEMLPANFPLPIAIVQHMPVMFTSLLAERLNSITALEVCEGSDGMEFCSGRVIIGRGGLHMRLEGDGVGCHVQLTSGAPENSCRPAVDVLFRSAAAVFGGNVLTVVLTGMGKDGLLGAEQLHQRGSPVIVQDAATSTVWGMPGAIAQAGFADAVLPLPQIVPELMRYL